MNNSLFFLQGKFIFSNQFQKGCKILQLKVALFYFLSLSYCLGVSVNGPANVCPGASGTYTVSFGPFLCAQYWEYYDDYTQVGIGTPQAYGTVSGCNQSFPVTVFVSSAPTNGPGALNKGALFVKVGTPGFQYAESQIFFITRDVPVPAQINGGLINVCSNGEQVSLSVPALTNYVCGFCGDYKWTDKTQWGNLTSAGNGPAHAVHGSNTATLIAPNPISGSGYVTYIDLHAECVNDQTMAQKSTTYVYVGTPSVSNGLVNGSPGGTPTYVPGGYATLSTQIDGGGSTNWYVANGSGSLWPSYNYCTVSWSGFIRVVVDASNRCGTGGSWTFYLTTQQNYYGYRIAPNPAKEKLSLLLDYKELIGEAITDVSLYDTKNRLWYSANAEQLKTSITDANSIDIRTLDFPKGTYFLHVKVGNEVKKEQIIVE
ncbi:hypothetical protein GCM10028807_36210 [Spirosoma daeguense]